MKAPTIQQFIIFWPKAQVHPWIHKLHLKHCSGGSQVNNIICPLTWEIFWILQDIKEIGYYETIQTIPIH
jgi:hypothetical protein